MYKMDPAHQISIHHTHQDTKNTVGHATYSPTAVLPCVVGLIENNYMIGYNLMGEV